MKTIAIIPARGGSKSVPGKNIKRLAGKPLLAWTVEAARSAKSIERTIVSTDDPVIREVTVNAGAEVVFRPAEISGDAASSESALLHVLAHLATTERYAPDLVVFLQCTSPMTWPEDIDGTVHALLESGADSALAVAPFHHFLWRDEPGTGAEGINHDKAVRLRRQDMKPQYIETGAIYAMKVDGFLKSKHRFFGKTAMYVIPRERCLEIDDPVDFAVAEILMRNRETDLRAAAVPRPVSALVMDFDGVFTDNRVFVLQDGREAVACNRGDGLGLSRLKQAGVPMVVISTETNPVVQARCDKLGLPCIQGETDKVAAMTQWLKAAGLDMRYAVYLGNDVNDVGCLGAVGCPVVVCDAHPMARAAARIVLSSPGGLGAIRELADLILNSTGGH